MVILGLRKSWDIMVDESLVYPCATVNDRYQKIIKIRRPPKFKFPRNKFKIILVPCKLE